MKEQFYVLRCNNSSNKNATGWIYRTLYLRCALKQSGTREACSSLMMDVSLPSWKCKELDLKCAASGTSNAQHEHMYGDVNGEEEPAALYHRDTQRNSRAGGIVTCVQSPASTETRPIQRGVWCVLHSTPDSRGKLWFRTSLILIWAAAKVNVFFDLMDSFLPFERLFSLLFIWASQRDNGAKAGHIQDAGTRGQRNEQFPGLFNLRGFWAAALHTGAHPEELLRSRNACWNMDLQWASVWNG